MAIECDCVAGITKGTDGDERLGKGRDNMAMSCCGAQVGNVQFGGMGGVDDTIVSKFDTDG